MLTDVPKTRGIDVREDRASFLSLSATIPAAVKTGPGCARTVNAISFLIVAALAVAVPAPAWAGDADCQALMAQLQRLEAQIRTLDTKVSALEQARTAGAPATAATPSAAGSAAVAPAPAVTTSEVAAQAAAQLRREDAAVVEGWKRIERGLSQDRVKQLLGAPQQTFDLSGKLVWYYYYPAGGSGSVLFDPGGRVVGYQTPPSSGFRLY